MNTEAIRAKLMSDASLAHVKIKKGLYQQANEFDDYAAGVKVRNIREDFEAGYQQAVKDMEAENERLKAGLQYYADSKHCWGKFPADWVDWDTCSGEPTNWWFNSEEAQEQPVGVEDGTIAKMILNGAVMTPDSDETECVMPEVDHE